MEAQKFAAALLCLLLSACSTQTTPATDTNRPTVATHAPSPFSSTSASPPAPSPLPSATEAVAGLEIVEWYRWSPPPAFEGDTPNTYVEVLVRNPYDYPVHVHEPVAELLNAGETVHRTRDIDFFIYSDVGWNLILPGETVPGRICACAGFGVIKVPEWDSIIISAELEQADPIPYTTEIDVRSGPFNRRDNGAHLAQGTATNSSGQPLRMILLRAIARDAGGRYVGSGFIGIIGDFVAGKYQSLEAGSVHEFSISIITDPFLPNTLSFEVRAFGILEPE